MLYEEEKDESFRKSGEEIVRTSRGEGRFVLVRFRTKADLDKFANLLDLPQLRGMKRDTRKSVVWSQDKSLTDPLSNFM